MVLVAGLVGLSAVAVVQFRSYAMIMAVDAFLTRAMLAEAEPADGAAEDKVTFREVLDRAALKIGQVFAGQPDLEVLPRERFADYYHGLAAWDSAEAQWRAILAMESRRRPRTPRSCTRVGNWATSSITGAGQPRPSRCWSGP